MFIVQLKFSTRRDQAGRLLEGHRQWLERGFEDGVFLVAGNLQPALGGGILAHGASRSELERRLSEDPFVAEGVVSAELIELAASKVDPRLGFLMAEATVAR